MNNFPHLFQLGRIGGVEVKNRIVMAPMGTGGLVGYKGIFSDRLITYYERRAKGGTGLIITGLTLVDPKIEPWEIDGVTQNVTFDSHWKVPNLLQLTERVHDFGTKIFAQLTAGFGRVFPAELAAAVAHTGTRPVAPSEMPLFWNPSLIARELATEEVDGLVAAFGTAALIAKMGGFDGVELHGHEGYLMDQFTTSLWNKRRDKYGGDLRGRMTFVLSITSTIQKMAGADFPIIYRYGLEHKIPGGRTPDEGIDIARLLEDAGVAALHVDAGCYDNWFWPHPPEYQQPGCMVAMAAMVKPHVKIPVITVGRLGYADLAERIIEEGKADFIGLGRPLLADPDFSAKAQRGQTEEIRPCIGCHECFARIIRRQSLSCAVNPECGDEERLAVRPAVLQKKVMVIGGGPSGMVAALISALRGHDVTLYEKRDRLGGTLQSAGQAPFKQDIGRLLKYQISQLDKSSAKIRLMTEVTEDLIRSEAPDVIFLASGSAPLCEAGIRGLEKEKWVTPEEAYSESIPSGTRAYIVGGGSVGCEMALYLAGKGGSVVLVEMTSALATDLITPSRVMLLELLREHRVKLLTMSEVREITPSGVLVSTPRGEEKFPPADMLVLCVGRRSEAGLAQAAQRLVDETYLIGDCVAPRKIKDAIWEAFKLAITV